MKKIFIAALLFVCGTAAASTSSGFGLSVLVDEDERPEYAARGNVYVEAIRGANYSLRLTNPTPYRVAVALSVDGLNTIDAKHTDPWNAAKWILELPRGIRFNVISPPWLTETLQALNMKGVPGLPADVVAKAYVRSVTGNETGQVIEP